MCVGVGGRGGHGINDRLLLFCCVMSFVDMSIAMAALLLEGYEDNILVLYL